MHQAKPHSTGEVCKNSTGKERFRSWKMSFFIDGQSAQTCLQDELEKEIVPSQDTKRCAARLS